MGVGHNLIDIYKNAPLGLLWLHTVKLSSFGAPFLLLSFHVWFWVRLDQKINEHIKTHSVVSI